MFVSKLSPHFDTSPLPPFALLKNLNIVTFLHSLPYSAYLCRKLHDMENEKGKKERTVIHIWLKETDTHRYFGSLANIYEHLTVDDVGITYGSLRNYGLSSEKPYENAKCIIRKGLLLSKSGNRGRKPTSRFRGF